MGVSLSLTPVRCNAPTGQAELPEDTEAFGLISASGGSGQKVYLWTL